MGEGLTGPALPEKLEQLIAAGERQRLSSGAQPLVTSNAPINNANKFNESPKEKRPKSGRGATWEE